jgi:hypothetical protein
VTACSLRRHNKAHHARRIKSGSGSESGSKRSGEKPTAIPTPTPTPMLLLSCDLLLIQLYLVRFQSARDGAVHIGDGFGQIGAGAHFASPRNDIAVLALKNQEHG